MIASNHAPPVARISPLTGYFLRRHTTQGIGGLILMDSHASIHRCCCSAAGGAAWFWRRPARLLARPQLANWRAESGCGCNCNLPFAMASRWDGARVWLAFVGAALQRIKHESSWRPGDCWAHSSPPPTHPPTHPPTPSLSRSLPGPLAALIRAQLARARIQPTALAPCIGLPAALCLLVRPPACCQPGVAGLVEATCITVSSCNHLRSQFRRCFLWRRRNRVTDCTALEGRPSLA
jgi:hypothetical protein